MKKGLFAIFGVVLLILILVAFFRSSIFKGESIKPLVAIGESVSEQESADISASFGVFTNGVFRSFSASKYHNLSSDVYIGPENPNVVMVKKTGTTWGDFFETLPLGLTDSCLTTGLGETFCSGGRSSLKFYLNGGIASNLLSLEIKDGDSLLVSFGLIGDLGIGSQIEQVGEILSE